MVKISQNIRLLEQLLLICSGFTLHTIVRLFIFILFTFYIYNTYNIGTFDQIYCPYFEIFQ